MIGISINNQTIRPCFGNTMGLLALDFTGIGASSIIQLLLTGPSITLNFSINHIAGFPYVIAPAEVGIYNIQATDLDTGETATLVYNFTAYDEIIFTASVVCGGTIFINPANPDYEYSIDGGSIFQLSNIFLDVPAGTYTVVVRGPGACVGIPQTIIVSVHESIPFFKNSIFAQFFTLCCTTPTQEWCENVLDKLHRLGIVPQYIAREFNTDITNPEDADYLAFWKTITCFYALVVCFAGKFEDLDDEVELLRNYLQQRGLFVCQEDGLQTLNFLKETFYDQIRQRGTMQIVRQTDLVFDQLPSDQIIFGELLRLICYDKVHDEFLFNVTTLEKMGWTINHMSPCYRGTSFQTQLNKAPEDTQDFVNRDLFIKGPNGFVNIITDGDKQVAQFTSTVPVTLSTPLIKINPFLRYEITFQVRTPVLANKISLYVTGYDRDMQQLDLMSIVTGADDNNFATNFGNNRSDTYYFIRCIIYSAIDPLLSVNEALLNHGVGQCLQFKPIHNYFQFTIDWNSIGNDLLVWDFKIRPVMTDYSTAFIHASPLVQVWMQLNNKRFTRGEVEENITRYLLPYNKVLKVTWLDTADTLALNAPHRELREDNTNELREQGTFELREN